MKNRRQIQFILSSLVIVLLYIVAFLPSSVFGESYTLRVASAYPPPKTSLASKYLKVWEEMVSERTNGDIKFKNYWGGSLGSAAEHLSLVQNGVVDIAVSYGWYTPSKLPLQDFDYVFPFGPIDPLIVTKACRQIYSEFQDFEKNLNKYNTTRVFQSPGTPFVFLSKEPLKSLEDFKGLKCAVIGRYFGQWIKETGATPVTAPASERYTMLQTDVVDVSFNPIDLAYAFKDAEQAPYCLDPHLLVTNWISCWINLDTLNKLPGEYKEIILNTGKELEIKGGKRISPEWTKKVMSEWQESEEFVYNELSKEDMEIWANNCDDIPAQWAKEVSKKGYPGWEIINRYQEITAELGHEWIREWGKKK